VQQPDAGIKLGLGYDALLHQVALQRGEPPLVVTGRQVVGGRHPLDAVAGLVNVDDALHPGCPREHEDGLLPVRVKDRLVLLAHHRPETVHPTHVVRAVHAPASLSGP
jgi:hypothetical protein